MSMVSLLHAFALFVSSMNLGGPLDRAKLRAPEVLDHAGEAGSAYVRAVAAVLDARLSTADRRRLGTKVLSPRRLAIVEGSFGRPGALVALNVELRPKSPDQPAKVISGIFTLTSSGELGEMIVAPKLQDTRFVLTGIGDADGDGQDDFGYIATTGDTLVEHVVHWDGGKPVDAVRSPAQ